MGVGGGIDQWITSIFEAAIEGSEDVVPPADKPLDVRTTKFNNYELMIGDMEIIPISLVNFIRVLQLTVILDFTTTLTKLIAG